MSPLHRLHATNAMRHTRPEYLHPLVRWSFVTAGVILAVYLSPFVPPWWHSTASLLWLHRALPWWVQSFGFVMYVLLLTWGRIGGVVVGCALGAFFFLCELIALFATISRNPTINGHHLVNAYLFVGVGLVITFHIAAGIRALLDLETP